MSDASNLVRYFRRAGVVSGPLRANTRHSDLSTIKTWLIGDELRFGYSAAFNFGSAVHSSWLVKKKGNWKLSDVEQLARAAMLRSLDGNPIATKLLTECTDRERRRGCKLNGVAIKFTPDANGKKRMLDLKTTACRSLKDFIAKSFQYGYFRQGVTYLLATGCKEYYIIGIQKSAPFQVFIVWLQDPRFRDWLEYANEELKFLLYFYQNYGSPKYRKVS